MTNDFDDAIGRMGAGIRRAHAAFNEADEAFIEALEGLKLITKTRGSLEDRLTEMTDTIGRLESLVLEQSGQLRDQSDQIKALKQRIDHTNKGATE